MNESRGPCYLPVWWTVCVIACGCCIKSGRIAFSLCSSQGCFLGDTVGGDSSKKQTHLGPVLGCRRDFLNFLALFYYCWSELSARSQISLQRCPKLSCMCTCASQEFFSLLARALWTHTCVHPVQGWWRPGQSSRHLLLESHFSHFIGNQSKAFLLFEPQEGVLIYIQQELKDHLKAGLFWWNDCVGLGHFSTNSFYLQASYSFNTIVEGLGRIRTGMQASCLSCMPDEFTLSSCQRLLVPGLHSVSWWPGWCTPGF